MAVDFKQPLKKACLCAINSKFIHSNPAVHSLKAYYEGALGEEKAWSITVKEYTVNDVCGNIVYDIVKERPHLLGLSVYIWNVETVKRILPDLREILPETVIVLGGPEVSFGTAHCDISEELFDFVIEGEGELAFKELLDELSGGGASFDCKIRRASRCLSMDEVPFIYNDGNIELFKNRIVYYETSRGCPFACAYCLSGGDKTPVRFLAEETVFRHIDWFCERDVPLVKFVDRTFNCNPLRAKNIVRKIASLGANCATCFHFEVGADLFDDEFLELLSKLPAGRVQIEAGIQSTNIETLNASVRKTDNEKVFKNLKTIMSHGNINVHTDLIAGLPFEDIKSFKNSFNEVYKIGAHQLQLGFLKRLQGAPLCKMQDEHGLIFSKTAPYEILRTNWLSFEDIMELKRVEAALERYYNSGYYVRTLASLDLGEPYEFYRKLSCFLEEKGELFSSCSKRRAFDLLFEFLHDDGLATVMLLDYFETDKSELPPESLKFMWRHSRAYRGGEAELFKAAGIEDFNGFGVRYIGGKVYIFDYNEKNPVSGRYGEMYESFNVSFGRF